MKKSKVSAETRDKTIKEADLGVAGWALKAVRRTTAFRKRKSGKVPTGEIAYRFGQVLLGLVAFMVVKGVFGIPFNFVSGLVLAGFLFGCQFGAVRFSVFSLIYWAIVGTVLGLLVGMWPLSPSWWGTAADGWSGGEAVPKIAIGGGLLATVVWIATGRLATKGMGRAFSDRLEAWTFARSQDVQKQREHDVEIEFEKAGVSRAEVDDLARRNESDRRRAVVFGGSTRRRRAEGEGVSLAKTEEPEPAVDPTERSQRLTDLAGHVDEKDEGILAGLASGPDLGGMFGTAPKPSSEASEPAFVPSYDDDDIPGPSANAMTAVDADDADDDIPGPSNASSGNAATAIMEIAEKVEAPVPAVSAPKINPEASRGRRRMSREDLGKMIDLFNIMSREDNLTMFVNATRSKLIRLTDEDYEELRTMDGGDTLITLSQDLKLNDQSRGRTAIAASPVVVVEDETSTGRSDEMAETSTAQVASPEGVMLVDAMELMRTAASGRVPLGAAPAPVVDVPVEGEVEDFENEPAVTAPAVAAPSAPVASTADVPPVVVEDERPHEISAVTARGESVSFDVDISDNESTDPEMRRYPTPYASERVSILNNPALADGQKIERLRALDRSQGVSTVEMFESDDFGALLNLPTKVVSALRAKVTQLLGEKPSDMSVLQRHYERRLELVEKDMFERPHEYQRILHAFMTVGADIQDLVVRLDTPQAREIMENSIRLDPWFERNLTGLRAGTLKSALPRPSPGPGVLDRFSGTVDAAMRGAGFAARPVVDAPVVDEAPRASEAIIDMPVRPVVATPSAPEPAPEVRTGRRFEKGVDAQWAPDALPGSDLYNKEMAEHFSMIVKRNDSLKAKAEREANEAAERERREENERAERQRQEEDRLAREQAENDRERREREFFAALPKSEGGPFVKHLPSRFMTDRIMAAITGIVDGHVIVSRLHHEYVTQKIAFLNQWEADKGSQPDAVDELSAPGQRLQAEVGVRNGDLARDLLSHVAAACGLQGDALHDEILARLADDEETEFVRRVENVRERGEELRGLVDASDRREKMAIAEAAREEARRQIGESKADDAAAGERVQKLETDLKDREREADRLRADVDAAADRVAAAEAAALDRQAAADAAIQAAADMAERVRELEARIAVSASDGDASGTDEEADGLRQFEALVAEHLKPLEVQADLRAYTTKVDTRLLVVVDLPEAMADDNEMMVGGRRLPLVEGLKRTVMRPAFNSDPMIDTLEVTIVTNTSLPADVTGENLDLENTEVVVCTRDAKELHRSLRGYGVL